MAYRLKHSTAVDEEFARIVEEQIDKAVEEIDDPNLDAATSVHQARKRCKKIRAVLHLARGPLDKDDAFDRENAWFRDIAAALSGLRDAEVLVATHDALAAQVRDPAIQAECTAIRERLVARQHTLGEAESRLAAQLETARGKLLGGRERVRDWAFRVRNFKGLEPGLKRTYRRGRRAMRDAYDTLSDEAFHEWRKQLKYHWYTCRLLRETWPAAMDARRAEASRLAELLGAEHDLSVYHATLNGRPQWLGELSYLAEILAAAEQRRAGLRRDARPLGLRLYTEKPAQLTARFAGFWRAWHEEHDDQTQLL